MEQNTKVEIIDPTNQKKTEDGNSRRNKYIILAILIFIAVFIYDVSPLDLMPLIPIDDIAVTGGGIMGLIALVLKYFAGSKKK